jgi:hypothetical protein
MDDGNPYMVHAVYYCAREKERDIRLKNVLRWQVYQQIQQIKTSLEIVHMHIPQQQQQSHTSYYFMAAMPKLA